MVWKDRSGKYLRLDDVRIKYDSKLDSVVLTTKDSDVLSKTNQGFRIVVPRNSPEDKALRGLLQQYDLYSTTVSESPFAQPGLGIIPGDDWSSVPINNNDPHDLSRAPEYDASDITSQFSDTTLVTLGTDENDRSVYWDYTVSPHFMIVGLPGTGKTVAIDSILPQLTKNQAADVFVADPKRLPLTKEEKKDIRRRLGKRVSIATTRDSIKRQVRTVEDIRRTRSSRLMEDPKIKFDPVFLVLDETAVIFNHDDDQYNLREIHRSCVDIACYGRVANVHLIMSTQTLHYIPAIIRNQMTTFVSLRATGTTAQVASDRLFGSSEYATHLGNINRQYGFIQENCNQPHIIKMANPVQ